MPVQINSLGDAVVQSLAEKNAVASSAWPRPHLTHSPAHNLPSLLSSFIGREREIAEVKRMLATSRLVTLTGMGGCGKTRLAIKVAAELTGDYAWGVWLVELAALMDPAFVPQAVASSLGVVEQRCCTFAEMLTDFLRSKQLLLILDNCEHVIGACARLAEFLLQACPHLVILATSREALGITGEFTFPVPPFSLPESRSPLSLEALMQSEAVQLLMDRVAAVQPGFELTSQNAESVVQICRQLDGVPLAIELAAARVKTLTVEQIAARLDDRFNLLTLGSRTATPRHQTLRGVVDWSYELLSEKEQILFQRLSVFAGGWTLEAAEAICKDEDGGHKGENGKPIAEVYPSEVLDLLTQLVNKSLVLVKDQEGRARYQMLETIRQYARGRLLESRESGPVRDRHLEFFRNLVEEAGPHLRGPEQVAWFDRLEADYDNLRAAIEWSLEGEGASANARAEVGLRLAAAGLWFWSLRDHRSESSVWLDRVLARNPAPSAFAKKDRAEVLCGAGFLASWRRDLERAISLSEESLALFRELGDEGGVGRAIQNLAGVANNQEDYSRGRRLAEESAALLRKVGDKGGLVWTLHALGDAALRQRDYVRAADCYQEALALGREIGDLASIAMLLPDLGQVFQFQGEYERATPLLEESLILARQLGGKAGIPYTLAQMGQVALHQGDDEKAVALCEESLGVLRELGYNESIHWPLDLLGIAACQQGEYERAAAFFKEALISNRRFGYRQGIAENLAGLGAVAAGQGQLESAVRLFGAAQALLDPIGTDLGPADREQYDHCVAIVRSQLDEATFAKAWAEGQAMTREQAMDYASVLVVYSQDATPPARPLPSRRARQEFGGLTPRERQVAVLVAQGKSNREIAEELVLSERTVENHVGNILSKLDFGSRSQIAAWAAEKGLVKSTS
jgi:predicted ATPase/DNA-binding NarL/FixJ family response regulator